MPDERRLRGLLHGATHRLPGVPAHTERPAGHQGATRHGHAWRHRGHDHGCGHSSARTPRVLVSWQRRVAALFGRDL